MHKRIFQQIELGIDPSIGSQTTVGGSYTDYVTIQIHLTANRRGKIGFEFKSKYSNSLDLCYENDKNYINITRDMVVKIELKGDLWFSKNYDAITLKDSYSELYCNLSYNVNSYEKKFLRHKTIQFFAKKFEGGSSAFSQGFSLNVDLLTANEKWLPLTIDPDFKNPPPPPGQFEAFEEGDESEEKMQFLAGAD